MLVVGQGSSGAGKTTALRGLERRLEDATYIPEIVLPFDDAGDGFFIDNDLAKAKAAQETLGQVALVDRDFTSTLAFIAARDGIRSETYKSIERQVVRLIKLGRMSIADTYFLFNVPFEVSAQRQPSTNHPIWLDKDFVEDYDRLSSEIRPHFIPSETIVPVDGTDSPQVVEQFCMESLKNRFPSVVQEAPLCDRPFMQLREKESFIRIGETYQLAGTGLIILKPDVFERGLQETILAEISLEGFEFMKLCRKRLNDEEILRLWPTFWTEEWWQDAVDYMTSGDTLAILCKKQGIADAAIHEELLQLKHRLRNKYQDSGETRPQVSLLHTAQDEEERALNVSAYWTEEELSLHDKDNL